jgi:hypothetical protein
MDEQLPTYDLLYLIRAYNRGENGFDEWLRLSKDWAEHTIRQANAREQSRVNIEPSSGRPKEVR